MIPAIVLLNIVTSVVRYTPLDSSALLYETKCLNACRGFSSAYIGSVSRSFKETISITIPILAKADNSFDFMFVRPSTVEISPYLLSVR